MANGQIRVVTTNRKARHDYHIIDTLEAGIALKGSEVKSIREGRVNLQDAYARFKKGELWLVGMHISPYKQAAFEQPDPVRDRKLLLHKRELKRLFRQTEEKGVTIVPLKIYFKKHLVKIELGIAKGKRQYDKRAAIAERDQKREMDRLKKLKY
ncbi:SsrA-binding protein SmpB [Calditrichota bacterium LG25]|uniref:SsrA-binding protein n=1 Tax=Caldithrix abyssi DSM 13497 TaxID=880073 RepID=H1XUA6_CALAY|nr:SsrA-binding protein SmpB [Caldithrix abyssi]APF17496.1 smpB SsrA-binding protein [Caldithrix abyssi DSM 13497]EHO41596.1 SsrA-binding protein [Caldithrix abyssi DSM 13497]